MAGIPRERGKEIRSEDADTSGAQREDVQHKMKQRLYTALMDHKREEVADFYQDKSVPTKINTAGDTILHLAILTGSDGEVIKLMELMEKQDKRRMEKFVQARNVWGCTPLHQAAFVGMVNVCSFIANHYRTQEVVQPRNKRGETPLHVAVLHGHKEAFLTLQTIIEREGWSALNKKDGGNTILHSAIFREHFDLALIIIKKYPMLVDDEDEEGYSALHILATKLSAFKSGIQLSLLDSFIYHSIHPKDKQLDHPTDKEQKRQDSQDDHKTCDVEGVK
ncbi:uncharacterized protein [Elaeis guineensis]|uniref:uncharacterized protein n=1 Tax=Elaeis guineensis var. tenera TaxID=51953 RepID=UPI003C6D5609